MAAKRSVTKKKTTSGKATAPRKKSAAKKGGGKSRRDAGNAVPDGGDDDRAEVVGDAAPTDARVRQIQAIVDVMLAAGAVELETEDGSGGRLRIRLKEDPPNIVTTAMPAALPHSIPHPMPHPMPHPVHPAPAAAPQAVESQAAADAGGTEVLASPMVGTFYRAPSPDADPFVNVGDAVGDETTICVIEAMKVMNEIKAEMNCRIVEILVENGEPVEFGQPLFRVSRS